jgi:hypothetical protein
VDGAPRAACGHVCHNVGAKPPTVHPLALYRQCLTCVCVCARAHWCGMWPVGSANLRDLAGWLDAECYESVHERPRALAEHAVVGFKAVLKGSLEVVRKG